MQACDPVPDMMTIKIDRLKGTGFEILVAWRAVDRSAQIQRSQLGSEASLAVQHVERLGIDDEGIPKSGFQVEQGRYVHCEQANCDRLYIIF